MSEAESEAESSNTSAKYGVVKRHYRPPDLHTRLSYPIIMNCQNCRTPLKTDSTLQDLDPASFEVLVGSAGQSVDPSITPNRLPYPTERKEQYVSAAKDASTPVFRRSIPSVNAKGARKDDPTMSFAMLTESEMMPARRASEANGYFVDAGHQQSTTDVRREGTNDGDQSLAGKVEATTRMFEILSSRSDVDHPICTECTDLLLSSLKSRLDASTKERDAYISFFKSLNNSNPTASEISKAQASLASSKGAEAKALAELQGLEKEKADLDEEIATLEAEALALDEEEQIFWRSRNEFALELYSFQNERDALDAAYEHDAQHLEQLRRTNVYNDALHITSDGTFATINGLRLGRLPPKHTVDWAEINAAWGYATLLLATVADKLGFAFRGYRVKPMGSTSHIEQVDISSSQDSSRSGDVASTQKQKAKVHKLDLYSSGDIPLAGAIIHRRINAGMVAFLECLRQLCDFVENGTTDGNVTRSPRAGVEDNTHAALGMKLPYRIKNDKIGNNEKGLVSIRLTAGNDAEWTDACKYTLTCCKYLLAAMGKILDARG